MKLPSILIACFAIASTHLLGAPPAEQDIVIHQLAERRVIIERAPPPLNLPAPPTTSHRQHSAPHSAEHLAELAAQQPQPHQAHPFIHAAATIYQLPNGQTISHITQFSVNNGPKFSFWTPADFSLIAHPGTLTTPQGTHYQLLILHTTHHVRTFDEIHQLTNPHKTTTPDLESLTRENTTWLPDPPNTPDQATTKALNDLHAYHNQNLDKLKTAHTRRQAEITARQAELAANPPQARDIHLRVSRLNPEQAAAWHQHATQQKGGNP